MIAQKQDTAVEAAGHGRDRRLVNVRLDGQTEGEGRWQCNHVADKLVAPGRKCHSETHLRTAAVSDHLLRMTSLAPARVPVSNAPAMAALVFGAAAMGVSPIFVRLADVGPFASAFWRVMLALPVLWVWMRVSE